MIFYCGLRNANSSLWEKVYKQILVESDDSEIYSILNGLTVTDEKNHLIYLLNETLHTELEDFDVLDVMDFIVDNVPTGVDIVLDFMLDKTVRITRM